MRQFRTPRRYRDTYGNLIIDGETYMGGVRTPPMPQRTALTDRVTGDVRVLSHDDNMDLVLVAPNPRWSDVIIYGPHDGPVSNGYRMVLDGGTVSFETDLRAINAQNALILTRRAFNKTVLLLTASAEGGLLTTQYTL